MNITSYTCLYKIQSTWINVDVTGWHAGGVQGNEDKCKTPEY